MSTLNEENEEEESVIQSKISLKIEQMNKHVEIRTQHADDDHLFVDHEIQKMDETLEFEENNDQTSQSSKISRNSSRVSSRASKLSEVEFYDRTYGSHNYASPEFASKNYSAFKNSQ